MNDHTRAPLIEMSKGGLRAYETARVTVIGAIANVLLAAVKFAAGVFGHSAAMVADAAHSLSDLVTDAVVFISVRIAAHEADEEHPYGHGRAETIGTAAVGAALILIGLFILLDVIDDLIHGLLPAPTWLAAAAAVVSIVVKEGLYHYTARVGRKHDNDAVVANAWHHRTDSLSSVAALAGIGGAMMGFALLDPLAAIVVVFMIAKVGWEITWKALQDLMDVSVAPEKLRKIREVISGTEGVRRFHELRTRRLGADIFVDAHIQVQPNISVSEAHNIAETVRHNLKKQAGAADALIHIDAEEDINYRIVRIDKGRVEKEIRDEAARIGGIKDVSEMIFHYLNGKVCVDFNVDMDDSLTIGQAKSKIAGLRERILQGESVDNAVIRGRLTDGVLETHFNDTEKRKKAE